MSSTSLLFFYRVRAVYSDSKIIAGVFGFLWVATAGLSMLSPFSTHGEVSAPNLALLVDLELECSPIIFLPLLIHPAHRPNE